MKKYYRCALCGRDVERVYPITLKLCKKCAEKVWEITNHRARIKPILDIAPCYFCGKISNPYVYYTNIMVCEKCIKKIGRKDKEWHIIDKRIKKKYLGEENGISNGNKKS